MSEKRNRPNYTKEFKQDAVKIVVEQRYSCAEVGRRLGIAVSNVSRWYGSGTMVQGRTLVYKLTGYLNYRGEMRDVHK